MPSIYVERSLELAVSADKAFSVLSDFHQWRSWSPWLITEPEAQMHIAADALSYSWQGKRVGQGSMHIEQSNAPNSLRCQLNFIKPWKSIADVAFDVQPLNDKTCKVTWSMQSQLPFFMFWMKKPMQTYIGMDYERGLLMLKDYLELGRVESTLEFDGEAEFPSCAYIGIKTQCSCVDVGPSMQRDFNNLEILLKGNEAVGIGKGLSIYHLYDAVQDKVSYTAAFQVEHLPESVGGQFITGHIPKLRVYKIAHIGPYRHLGNAWSAMVALARAKLIRCGKQQHPFEIYENKPADVDESELRTSLCFPLK
ncbi:SRPBCC family protein [Agaribacterium sp. ZY112]|uniref:SRPBCC family protein n=1 Tax=Agaribacterium sp. ZY112 TaxID=3233574 RepID=UPI003523B842